MPTSIRAFLSAAALLAGLAPVAAGDADKAFAALVACTPQFFAVLGESKSALGPATVSPVPDVDAETVLAISRAELARPAEAYGLHITGFIEMARGRKGKLESFWFGFRTSEPPAVVVRKIAEMRTDADFEQREDRYGWLLELEPKWHTDGDGTAIEHRYPLRMIEISPIKTKDVVGSVVRCGIASSKAGGMTTLPQAADLFLAPEPEPEPDKAKP